MYEGFVYFFIYSIRLAILTRLILTTHNLIFLKNFRIYGENSTFVVLLISLLRLVGIPPIIGFYGKLLVLLALAHESQWLEAGVLLFGSAVFILIYIRVCLLGLTSSQSRVRGSTNVAKVFLLGAIPVVTGSILFIVLCVYLDFEFMVDREIYHT